ncbi:MAG TPA: NAD(+) kinase [Candidatus Tenderia sp.]|nr:NAD(+) kinase [Candidatus Tenderia sp.]
MSFETIGIIGKFSDPTLGNTIETLGNFLRARGLKVLLEQGASETLTYMPDLETADIDTLGSECDMAIIVGGDGTLLHAARELSDYDIPLIGVNLGRLGFLVDISPAKMTDQITEILEGRYHEEKRFLLRSAVIRDNKMIHEGDAFNDVVVHKWNTVRMIEFETYVDGLLVNSQRSDGLIISTPTGSTAYALSTGGPIMHPSLNAVVLVPVCPHTLSNRPLVICGDSFIELVVKEGQENQVHVTLDGQLNFGIQKNDRLQIRKKEKPIRLLHPTGHDHFQILRAKLRWG